MRPSAASKFGKSGWLATGVLMFSLMGLTSAQAKIDSQGETGFSVSHETIVAAPPEHVWQALMMPAKWWSGAHSWSGDAANFTMDARQGGCFCETLPEGGFVEHARVIFADKGKMLRLSGALGPLQSEALTGTLTIIIMSAETGTRLRFDYAVGGYSRFDLSAIAPAVDSVIGEQHMGLVRLANAGAQEQP